jgi:integrase
MIANTSCKLGKADFRNLRQLSTFTDSCAEPEIVRVPRIRLLPGERSREFVLNYALEKKYLESAPQALSDIAMLMLDTGLRLGETLALQWGDVRLEPVGVAKFGFVCVREGKSKNARRNVPLTARAGMMVKRRISQGAPVWPNAGRQMDGEGGEQPCVFVSHRGGPFSVDTLDKMHADVRTKLNLSKEFVLHSLRHTMLTRLGESGADAFTIMNVAGHSTVVVSQRYIHPSPESVERAFERLETLNGKGSEAAAQEQAEQETRALSLPTISTTMDLAEDVVAR